MRIVKEVGFTDPLRFGEAVAIAVLADEDVLTTTLRKSLAVELVSWIDKNGCQPGATLVVAEDRWIICLTDDEVFDLEESLDLNSQFPLDNWIRAVRDGLNSL